MPGLNPKEQPKAEANIPQPPKFKQTTNAQESKPSATDESVQQPQTGLASIPNYFLPPKFRREYAKTAEETTQSILDVLRRNFHAHPHLWSFVISQLLVSGPPVAVFLVGLAILTTFAAGVITFFALLVLGPVLMLTGFLGVCLWGWSWAVWYAWDTVRGFYFISRAPLPTGGEKNDKERVKKQNTPEYHSGFKKESFAEEAIER
ncbi:hypothetical protein MPDQ_007263 [Monascus purpureus]|uniref:Uncharacterized protein n=1 Tax=Monascus purpureus TaxID=5098 RepID=A0A507QSF6_MONPU|nr:hypothetical protein MPDQ_007263 [Monascus purpureus]BDD59499.1 hypothetical protein MAP00_004702 [Monascus purpureus]